jgi:uncharacterized membrane protein (UPF0127 family)
MIDKKGFLILIAGLVLAACQQKNPDVAPLAPQSLMNTTYQDHQRISLKVDDHLFEVEVVTTPQSTAQGLSGRTEIGADGMLFIFPKLEYRNFWMKEMKFELDIVWVANNRVVGITSDVPVPLSTTPLSQLPTYPSPEKVNLVLELPAGTAAGKGIRVGSIVQLP